MIRTSALLLTALAAAPLQAQGADSVVGTWRTQTRGGVVEITRCGASICGKIVSSEALRTNPGLKDAKNSDASLRGRALKGLTILYGFKQDGGVWSGGKIYNAEDGKTYSATVTPAGDQLKLKGCVFVPLCKTQTWTRVR